MKEIARSLKIKAKDDYDDLRDSIDALAGQGIITRDEGRRIAYARKKKDQPRASVRSNRLVGKFTVTRRGFAFVTVEGFEEDIYIREHLTGTAFHGDIVEVVPFAKPKDRHRRSHDNRMEGEVVAIVQRNTTRIVGTMKQGRHLLFVVPDDERFVKDVYLSPEDAGNAEPGEKVVVELFPWEDKHRNPEGKIVDRLGKAGDPRVEVLSVAHSFGLPMGFPREVEDIARILPDAISEETLRGRLDYRQKVCLTIDPEDAKDFDDAVSYEALENGMVRLGVHIADVSYYVREGTALDKEAYARGTSVYMVNEVIPMLPERLSNNLCSLKPNVDRLTFSVFMDVNESGKVEQYSIAKSVICSARRFTYEEVQEIIERGSGDFADVLLPLYALTKILLKRRRRNGSIDFDTPEAKFRFDSDGLPSQIIKKTRLDAHRLVEECMLLANKTVAKHIGQVKKESQAQPFVYRVHDVPDPGKLKDLAGFVKQFGYSLDLDGGSKALQKLLDRVKGSEVENVINEVALRSMAKAVYSEKNVGHYGLAFKYYTHFTSPIRRYPDLVVHRLLEEYSKGVSGDRRTALADRLPVVCRHSSDRERVAMDAERASVKVMQVEYMKRHLGDEFDGVIGGVTNFGLFVEVNDLLVEGMIRVRDLLDDYYLFDEKRYALRGRSKGREYRLGDKIKVRVVSINPDDRQIDFSIVR